MEIVEVVKDSFQEYEPYHSLVLFARGCNMACPECYNYYQVTKHESIGNSIDLIDKHITPIHEAVVFLGGEPTIWEEQLIASTMHVKMKHGLKSKLFTNGTNTKLLSHLAQFKLIDACSVDLKCVTNTEEILGMKISPEEYLASLQVSITIMLAFNVNVEIRTTQWDNVKDQMEAIQEYVKQTYPDINHIIQSKFNPIGGDK